MAGRARGNGLTGRRAADCRPYRVFCREKRGPGGNGPVKGPGPTGRFSPPTPRSAAAGRAGQSLHRPPKPPPAPRRGRKTCVSNRLQLLRAPRFLSSTVHGAFSLFAKERMGGALPSHHHGLRLPRASAPENPSPNGGRKGGPAMPQASDITALFDDDINLRGKSEAKRS